MVLITKELLSIRNKEVEHLHEDIKSMEEKINAERERHNNMLNRMSEAVKYVHTYFQYIIENNRKSLETIVELHA